MVRRPKRKIQNGVEKVALNFTEWVGSPASIIVHTILFVVAFVLVLFGVRLNTVLLVLTTAVSLEAIYLAIFIQMTVNRNTASLEEVEEDIDEIQEDVEEIERDIDEIQEDVDEIQVDVDKLEEEDAKELKRELDTDQSLDNIQDNLERLMKEIADLKQQRK